MALSRFHTRSAATPVADINLVPLIDVLLVLLVALLVSAPLVTSAVQVKLPRLQAAGPVPEERLTARLSPDGGLALQGRPVDRAGLRAALAEAAARPEPPVLAIEADGTVPYQRLADLLGEARQAGLARIAFVGLPQPGQPPSPTPPSLAPPSLAPPSLR